MNNSRELTDFVSGAAREGRPRRFIAMKGVNGLAIHLRTWRDIMLAGAIGLTAEAVIWLLDFDARRNLFGDVPVWVQIAELPGAQVADKLFSQGGLALAL